MFQQTRITKDDKLVVLTGAGISAESGVRTFRDTNGLWEDHSIEEVATPEGFQRNPQLVWDFYTARYRQLAEVKPNPGHDALVELEKHLGDNFLLITQNIDGLHQKAGSKNVLEMHGTIHSSYCNRCGKIVPTSEVIAAGEGVEKPSKTSAKVTVLKQHGHWFKCPVCPGLYRPDIIWFGEIPYHLEQIMSRVQNCTKFLVVGTSGVVYPAAQFLLIARQYGAYTIGVNLEKPDNASYLQEFHHGKSGQILPFLTALWIS